MSEELREDLPVPYEDDGAELEALVFGPGRSAFWTSLNIATPEGKKAALKALGNSDFAALYMRDHAFPTRDILVHQIEVANRETGEINPAVRAVLIGPDGTTVSFVSAGIVRSLKNIMALFGKPPWDPPLKMKVREASTRQGYRTYNLMLEE